MKKTLKKIFNMVWHVLVAVAFCGFIVLPFLHNAIDKTLGQWLWYPCLVVFLGYSFIPNKKMKEQSKFVQISSSGGILQLLFIISGILVINYYDTDYNWYWFAFVLIALSIPIGCVTVKAWAESKNTYSTEQVKAANVRLGKYIMFYWLLDLFYMACFNQWLVLQFVYIVYKKECMVNFRLCLRVLCLSVCNRYEYFWEQEGASGCCAPSLRRL